MIKQLIGGLAASIATILLSAPAASAQSLIRDTEIEAVLRDFTDPILEVAGLEPEDVGLFIINDMSLNAFVANGQRIHLHTGLIVASEHPGQLKGVIAHEAGHITGSHSVSRARAAEIASRPALISIGLGIIAIAAGAGDAGAALLASSQQFAALNFFTHTRAEEASADQAAIVFLEKLGESPAGLIEFFENYRYQEVMSESRRYPYFRTHPLSSDRIQSLRTRAEEGGFYDVPPSDEDVFRLEMIKAKIVGFLEPPVRVYRRYPPEDTSQPARYARAIAAYKNVDITTATREVDELIKLDPDNPYFYELKGQILFENARADESIPYHRKSLELAPREPLLLVNLARSLIVRNGDGDLEEAENNLRDALLEEPNNAFAWAQLAVTLERQGRRPEAELAIAEQAFHIGDYNRAYQFAIRASKDLPPNTPVYRRASDIAAVTDPRLRRANFRGRRGFSPTSQHYHLPGHH